MPEGAARATNDSRHSRIGNGATEQNRVSKREEMMLRGDGDGLKVFGAEPGTVPGNIWV
ncbi:hypothetical protein WN944_019464 [Citrus x changshan-huyou]|uniref:Uncharacterized protein n=1 Tax=Citrus x changshan-huyou TaxID=2935761 RepID=A0AAP0LYN0_9ROSI